MTLVLDDDGPVFSDKELETMNSQMEEAVKANSDDIPTDGDRDDLDDLPPVTDKDDGDESKTKDDEHKEKMPYEDLEKRFEQGKGAFKEERGKRRTAEEERDKIREENDQLKQAIATMQAIRQGSNQPIPNQAANKAEDLPNPETHALDFLKAVRQREIDREQASQAQYAQMQRQAALTQVHEQFSAYANELKEKVPDYEDAINHLRSERIRDYRMYGLDERTAEAEWNREASNMIVNLMLASAQQGGKHPAVAAYEYAQRRGYVPKGTQERVKNMQTMSKSLSGSTGTSGANDDATVTAEWVNEAADRPQEFLKRMKLLQRKMGIEG